MNKVRKIFTILLSAIVIVSLISPTVVATTTSPDGNWQYTILANDTIEVTAYIGKEHVVTVPDKIEDMIVSSIGSGAFSQNNTITSVSMPNSVTTIGSETFSMCSYLESVKLSSKIQIIDDMTFAYCESLRSISIPGSVIQIGTEAFIGCSSLSDVSLPSSLQYIGNEAFGGCTSLHKITIPNSVVDMGSSTFIECSSLSSVSLSSNITTIKSSVFSGCISLGQITLPANIGTIQDNAFACGNAFKDMYYLGTIEQWNKININNNAFDATNVVVHYEKSLDEKQYLATIEYLTSLKSIDESEANTKEETIKIITDYIEKYFKNNITVDTYLGTKATDVYKNPSKYDPFVCAKTKDITVTNFVEAHEGEDGSFTVSIPLGCSKKTGISTFKFTIKAKEKEKDEDEKEYLAMIQYLSSLEKIDQSETNTEEEYKETILKIIEDYLKQKITVDTYVGTKAIAVYNNPENYDLFVCANTTELQIKDFVAAGQEDGSITISIPLGCTTKKAIRTFEFIIVASNEEKVQIKTNVTIKDPDKIGVTVSPEYTGELFTQEEIDEDQKLSLLINVAKIKELTSNELAVLKNQEIEVSKDYTMLLDFNLLKKVGDKETQLTNLKNNEIEISIDIPAVMLGMNLTMLRIHDDQITVLQDIDNNHETYTFKTDRFSTYILTETNTSIPKANSSIVKKLIPIFVMGGIVVAIIIGSISKKRYA